MCEGLLSCWLFGKPEQLLTLLTLYINVFILNFNWFHAQCYSGGASTDVRRNYSILVKCNIRLVKHRELSGSAQQVIDWSTALHVAMAGRKKRKPAFFLQLGKVETNSPPCYNEVLICEGENNSALQVRHQFEVSLIITSWTHILYLLLKQFHEIFEFLCPNK